MRLIEDSINPYKRKFRFPKWNVPVNALHEPRILRHLPEFATWTRADHTRRARQLSTLLDTLEEEFDRATTCALRDYGDDGPLIAGCVREHFPEHIKSTLRDLASAKGDVRDAAYAHWRVAGRARHTFRNEG